MSASGLGCASRLKACSPDVARTDKNAGTSAPVSLPQGDPAVRKGCEAPTSTDHDLEDLLGRISTLAENGDEVELRAIHDLVSVPAFGPLLLIMAVIALTPIGAVPALPTALAIAVLLLAAQVVSGRHRLWLPGFIERRRVSSKRIKASVPVLRRPAHWLDAIVRPRLGRLTDPPFDRLAA